MWLSCNANASWHERDKAHCLRLMLCYVCCTKLQNLILLARKIKSLTRDALTPIPQFASFFPYDLLAHIAFNVKLSIGALVWRLSRIFPKQIHKSLVSYFDRSKLFLNFQRCPILTFPTITVRTFKFNVHK